MKRAIILAAIFTALGASIIVAGCTTNPDGTQTCDTQECNSLLCTYRVNGQGPYACNECQIGDELHTCDTYEDRMNCRIDCFNNCVGNCIEQNCNQCGNIDCGSSCDEEYVSHELIEGEDYTVSAFYISQVDSARNKLTLTYHITLKKTFYEPLVRFNVYYQEQTEPFTKEYIGGEWSMDKKFNQEFTLSFEVEKEEFTIPKDSLPHDYRAELYLFTAGEYI